jgi:hypothetical protein
MSVRVGDRLVITRRGSMLGRLRPEDLVETGIDRDDSGIALASSEITVHRAVYQRTAAQAILHTHPPHGVVLSLELDEIIPMDSEGSYLLHRIPVVSAEKTVGSEEMATGCSRRATCSRRPTSGPRLSRPRHASSIWRGRPGSRPWSTDGRAAGMGSGSAGYGPIAGPVRRGRDVG